jgi:electron transfer flavoprotein alpha subunit
MDFSYLDSWMDEELGGEAIEEGGEGYRNIWVLAETAGAEILPASLEALGQARELADQIGVYVYGLLLGPDAEPLADKLFAYGADKVLVAGAPALAHYQPELYVEAMAQLVAQYRPEILLMAATPLGNDLAPALAARLNTGLLSHCLKLGLDMSERLLLGTFPVLGGEVYNTAACPEARPQMATLLPGYFRVPYEDSYRTGSVEQVEPDLDEAAGKLVWAEGEAAVELPPVPLAKARIVVGAGRGLGDAQGFALVQKLAAALGGVVAGSRGALDEGWIGEDQVVGAGGQFIAPDLYLACGLSGDVYHYFGVQNSKYVVAINSDPKAPIMKAANIAIVGDARQVISAMLEALGA